MSNAVARIRRARARGFTLLEIMVAVAILGLGLTTIFAAQAGAFASAGHARNVSVATGLVRCKMSEVEQTLKQEGFQELDQTESGPCCDGVEDAKFSCAWRVEKLELPEDQLGQLDLDSDLDLAGNSGDKAAKPAGPDLVELGAAASGSGVTGIMGLMSKGKAGGSSDIGEAATALAGEDGAGMDGIASFVMGMVYPDLRTAFVEGTRRVTVTISWNEGQREHAIDVAQWIVDARAAGLRAAAEGENDVVDEEASADGSNPTGGANPTGGSSPTGGGRSTGGSNPFGGGSSKAGGPSGLQNVLKGMGGP